MNPSPDKDQQLERFVHRALRELPPRQAPQGLEARVLAEAARRAALPWWRKSFAHWPLAARAVFLVGCVGLVKLALMGTVWVMAGFDAALFRDAFATPIGWMQGGYAVCTWLADLGAMLVRNIPPLWLYAAAAFLATMYAAFIGLGTAAYRTLYANR
jgi:hypothetical protein